MWNLLKASSTSSLFLHFEKGEGVLCVGWLLSFLYSSSLIAMVVRWVWGGFRVVGLGALFSAYSSSIGDDVTVGCGCGRFVMCPYLFSLLYPTVSYTVSYTHLTLPTKRIV
eukprot:TRINITY_DN20019_c0_g1_i2.p1 TRINITY_DN20019_c0_g1~~TRINITY_DN20019_c0_g1_i2.p1  ORF type:complete len:111 (+),score=6.78 TRINITY_DN20019_c0_g1_i2:467-799(+)